MQIHVFCKYPLWVKQNAFDIRIYLNGFWILKVNFTGNFLN